MLSIRTRLNRSAGNDAGLSLVEVIVAMFIFAIISLAVASGLLTMMRTTNDAASRQTASSLASQAIDTARATTNLATLVSSVTPTTVVVGGRNYYVSTIAKWSQVTSGASAQCSTGTGALLNKSVQVTVKWDGMGATTTPAEADTIVAPVTRVSDVDKGVIIVSVKTASGTGNPGVTITAAAASPANGATAITSTIAPTDAQGCGYILNATPGDYVVKVAKSGTSTPSVDIVQSTTPAVTVTVTAGSATTAPFQFDQSAKFTTTYAKAFTTATGEGVVLPLSTTPLSTSFVSTYPMYVTTTMSGPYYLHPFSGGYSVIAGKLGATGDVGSSCLSVDPGAWPGTTDTTGTYSGVRPATVSAPAGGTANTADVPMGIVKATGPANGYIKAVAKVTAPAGTGDPGCASPSTYIFQLPASGIANLALPFGSWVLTSGTTAGTQTTAVNASKMSVRTRGVVTGVSGTDVLTLDPRTVVAP